MQGNNPEYFLPSREMSRIALEMKPENFQPGLSGKRRERLDAPAIRYPNKWGDTFAERYDQFDDWHDMAMQVVSRDGGSFRLLAIFGKVFDHVQAECLATDELFARRSGRCTVKTVSRELKALRQLGLIRTQTVWIEKGEKKVKGRRITLMIPLDLSGIHVR